MGKQTARQGEIKEGGGAFVEALEAIDDGHGVVDMSVELQKLMQNLSEHAGRTQGNAVGALTLKLVFSVEPNGITNIAYDMGVKTPKRKTGKTTMWVTRSGNLSVSNPRQQMLPEMRDVPARRHYTEIDNDNAHDVKDI